MKERRVNIDIFMMVRIRARKDTYLTLERAPKTCMKRVNIDIVMMVRMRARKHTYRSRIHIGFWNVHVRMHIGSRRRECMKRVNIDICYDGYPRKDAHWISKACT
jgi:hypothetical protein